MWQCVGECDEDIMFTVGAGDKSEMPGNAVISLDEAIECMRVFYDTGAKPECIKWRGL